MFQQFTYWKWEMLKLTLGPRLCSFFVSNLSKKFFKYRPGLILRLISFRKSSYAFIAPIFSIISSGSMFKSSHRKRSVRKICRKTSVLESFLINWQVLSPATLLRRDSIKRVFL